MTHPPSCGCRRPRPLVRLPHVGRVSALPDDIEALRRLIAAEREELAAAKAGLLAKALEIEKLKLQIAQLRRQHYSSSSEKMARALEQFELRLEELEAEEAADPPASTKLDDASEPAKRRTSGRRPLPAHLPRREVVHESSCVCLACGGAMRKVGEDVTEILDYVPGRFQVIRHVRPAFSCRQCESMAQAPMPALPVERGRPGPGLLAHVLVGKYCDHLPLYRQSGIYAREGVELDRAALAVNRRWNVTLDRRPILTPSCSVEGSSR